MAEQEKTMEDEMRYIYASSSKAVKAEPLSEASEDVKEEMEKNFESIDDFADITHEKPIDDWSPSSLTDNIPVINRSKVDVKQHCNIAEGRGETTQICDLCGRRAFPYLNSPKNQAWARYFFRNLIELTPKQLETANFYEKNNVHVTICSKHYREDASLCPSTGTSSVHEQNEIDSYEGMGGKAEDNDIMVQSEASIEDPSKRINDEKKKYVRTCDLCREKTNIYTLSPADPSMAWKFYDNLNLTSAQLEKVERLANVKLRATICSKHFKQMPSRTARPSICDVCQQPLTGSYRISPYHPSGARRFFENLIGLTPKMRERVSWFLRNFQRANVCMKHFETLYMPVIPAKKRRIDGFRAEKTQCYDGSDIDEEWIEEEEEPIDKPGPSR